MSNRIERQIERDEEAEIFLELSSLSLEQRQLQVQEHILRALLRNNKLSKELLQVEQANMGFLSQIVDELTPQPSPTGFKISQTR